MIEAMVARSRERRAERIVRFATRTLSADISRKSGFIKRNAGNAVTTVASASEPADIPNASENKNPAQAMRAKPIHAPMQRRTERGAVPSKINVRRVPPKMAMVRRTQARNMGQQDPWQSSPCRENALELHRRNIGLPSCDFKLSGSQGPEEF